jgi:aminomethyltransferase
MTNIQSQTPLKQTSLHDRHVKLGGKMVCFAGYHMPIYYTRIIEEHDWVRSKSGVFDVSHLGEVRVKGREAFPYIQKMIPTDLTRIGDHEILYTVLLNDSGSVLDDILVYRLSLEDFYLVINASGIEKVLDHLKRYLFDHVEISDESDNCACIAIQGPESARICDRMFKGKPSQLKYYTFRSLPEWGSTAWISRTGYTGEDGFEVFADPVTIVKVWDELFGRFKELRPIGLGARNTLRLESGNALYGDDLDDTKTPYEARLGWLVSSKEDFVGRDKLLQRKAAGFRHRLCGFKLQDKAVARQGYPILKEGRTIGIVTSGSFSPTLKQNIALGYVETSLAKPGVDIEIEVHKRKVRAQIVKLPFVPLKHRSA